MKVNTTNQDGHVVVSLSGRLDTSTSMQTNTDINSKLEGFGSVNSLTIDAGELDYISSSGLRILLSLANRFSDFRVTEVQPKVYEVLEVTGFTKIMNVEKAMRRLSVDGCEVIGIGGVGTVYRLDGDTIIKVFREGTTRDEVETEISMAKEAFLLGMPTAISFDVVRVGQQYGLVYELLRADTMSVCLAREPERLDEFARFYANLFRQLHSISVPQGSSIPSAMERERAAVNHIRRYFDSDSIDMLLSIVDSIPQGDRLLHCDLQTKNAMMQGNEPMLIDMGEVGYGHPILDLGHAYSAMVTFVGDYEMVIGMPRQLGNELWERMMDYYFESEPKDVIALRKEQIEAVSCVRNFSWLSLSDSFPEAVIRECQELFSERVTKRFDHISRICKTLDDWKL